MSMAGWFHRHRLLLAGLAYLLFAPPALFTLPLAALLVTTSLRSRQELLVAAGAGGWSLLWLTRIGDLPDQLLRAAAVIATGVFVIATRYTRLAVIHRSLVALACAAVAGWMLLVATGSSWAEVQWWAEYRAGYAARLASQLFWSLGGDSPESAAQVAALLKVMVPFQSDYFPAVDSLRIIAGLALATAIYRRVAPEPHGLPLARFREFRFTEHMGWVAIVPLLVVLLPKLAVAKLAAVNLLIVLGALYLIRGVAVVAFGLQLMGAGSGLFVVFAVIAALLMLPVVSAGAILLGVVDSGLDLRRRWTTPRTD